MPPLLLTKIIQSIFRIIGLLLLLFVISVGSLMLYSLVDKIDTFYIRDAEFDNPNFLHDLQERLKKEGSRNALYETPTVFMHRIKQGKGLIIGYRWYTSGSTAIDDESFKKITVWLPTSPHEDVNIYDLSDRSKAVIAFTQGGSAWPDRACAGHLNRGEMQIVSHDDKYSIAINGMLKQEALGTTLAKYPCDSKSISIDFPANEIAHDDLTSWLGKAGDHPYAESYR